MTHPFESNEKTFFRRFKTETLLEQSSIKASKVCQVSLSPNSYPSAPKPSKADLKPYVVPSHSRWFGFKEIHYLEELEFPEIRDLDVRKEYKKIRNHAVRLFRHYPAQELSPSTIRHVTGGEFFFIQKIHKFLSLWGLINFIIDPSPQDSTQNSESIKMRDDFIQIYDNQVLFTQKSSQIPGSFPCSTCKSECSDGHFISKKYPGIVLCPKCFTQHHTMQQIGAIQSTFEFHTLYMNKPKINNMISTQASKTIFENCDKKSFNWINISQSIVAPQPSLTPGQPLTPEKQFYLPTPYDCLMFFSRYLIGDQLSDQTIMSHKFNDIDPLSEMMMYNMFSSNSNTDGFECVNWEEYENEIEKVSSDLPFNISIESASPKLL